MPIIFNSIVNAFPGGDPMDHAVVMAGGSGTRFWPESRARRSKQFLDLTGGGPMIREAPLPVVLAPPADHAIGHVRAFQAVLRKGLRLARETGRFVTLGVPPTHPSTGYGYIERGKPFPGKARGAFAVARCG